MSRRLVAVALQSIAANVRRIRVKRGLTQEKLGETAGLETRTIQTLEAGSSNPSAAVLVSVAAALDVRPGALFRMAQASIRPVGRPRKFTKRHTSKKRGRPTRVRAK